MSAEALSQDPIRVAINGFGRIGRNFFQANHELGNPLEIVAANEPSDIGLSAHLLGHDSVNGGLRSAAIEVTDGAIVVDGKPLQMSGEREPSKLPWADLGIDVVIESTGFFTTAALAGQHLEAGARKVIVSAPADGQEVATIVMGINEAAYDPGKHDIISNASCTTNCLAPLAQVFDEAFGIERGFMTTTHAYTKDQNLHDGLHSDWRRARAAAVNIIPSSTGAAKAIGLVLPNLDGKLRGGSLRVPVPDGSITKLTVITQSGLEVDQINDAYRVAAEGRLAGILKYSDTPIVSTDVVGDAHSSIFDALLTDVNGNLAEVTAWYDNEWGFSNRLVDLTKYVGQRLSLRIT